MKVYEILPAHNRDFEVRSHHSNSEKERLMKYEITHTIAADINVAAVETTSIIGDTNDGCLDGPIKCDGKAFTGTFRSGDQSYACRV